MIMMMMMMIRTMASGPLCLLLLFAPCLCLFQAYSSQRLCLATWLATEAKELNVSVFWVS